MSEEEKSLRKLIQQWEGKRSRTKSVPPRGTMGAKEEPNTIPGSRWWQGVHETQVG